MYSSKFQLLQMTLLSFSFYSLNYSTIGKKSPKNQTLFWKLNNIRIWGGLIWKKNLMIAHNLVGKGETEEKGLERQEGHSVLCITVLVQS